jgi:hypothetical protein
MRELGDLTRAEALAGIPDGERDALLKALTAMKSNLLEACNRPVGLKDVQNG